VTSKSWTGWREQGSAHKGGLFRRMRTSATMAVFKQTSKLSALCSSGFCVWIMFLLAALCSFIRLATVSVCRRCPNYRFLFVITYAKQIMFSPVYVCLSVCLSVNRNTQKLVTTFSWNFLEWLDVIQWRNSFDCDSTAIELQFDRATTIRQGRATTIRKDIIH